MKIYCHYAADYRRVMNAELRFVVWKCVLCIVGICIHLAFTYAIRERERA